MMKMKMIMMTVENCNFSASANRLKFSDVIYTVYEIMYVKFYIEIVKLKLFNMYLI